MIVAFLAVAIIAVAAILWWATDGLAQFGRPPAGTRLERIRKSPQYQGDRFRNPTPRQTEPSLAMAIRLMPRWLLGSEQRTPGRALPILEPEAEQYRESPARPLRATWMGHSTVLMELDGVRILTDPVWSRRVSPLSFMGPVRFHKPPVALAQLPRLDAVLISHDHYDHLDLKTVRQLAPTEVKFVVSLGVGSHLEAWGIKPAQIVELDWWESYRLEPSGVEVVATPAHHLSGRGPISGRDESLWSSFVIKGPTQRVYFSGDSGAPTAFEEMGRKYGPFDLALLPIGAYGELWPDIHLTPEQSVSAFQKLGGGLLLPIHWGTLNLAFHAWHEPPERLIEAAHTAGIPFVIPMPGQSVISSAPPALQTWWRT